jgi:hypothetical protein
MSLAAPPGIMVELTLREEAAMISRPWISVLVATAGAALLAAPVLAGGLGAPSSGERDMVLAGGMSGNAGGMSGGAGGVGAGNFAGNRFGGPTNDVQPAARGSAAGTASDNFTYQCISAVGRCSFVAPAWLRANSLRSGADCVCGNGQQKRRVE